MTAKALLARYYLRNEEPAQALEALKSALTELQAYPWVQIKVLYRSLELGLELANILPDRAMEIFELFSGPFCVKIHEYTRKIMLIQISTVLSTTQGIKALKQVEPHVPWNEEILGYRLHVYQKTNHSLAALAQKELNEFLENKEDSFADVPRGQQNIEFGR